LSATADTGLLDGFFTSLVRSTCPSPTCTTRPCWPGAAARSGLRRLGRYSPSAGGATAVKGLGRPSHRW
jgi:hypothetical protein